MSDWDLGKKKAFTKAMGKGRPKFSKGGAVKKIAGRKYLANGTVKSLGNTVGDVAKGVGSFYGNLYSGVAGGMLGGFSNMLGTTNKFSASGAEIDPGTNKEQLNQSYAGAQDALSNQNNLVSTLQPQAGTAVQNQNTLADQYAAMSRGEGPNPALAQLHQATGANVANQAALMAGQRGSSANAGLIARQAAQQGAQTQQQAAGQAATLQAEQQIAAQNNLANLSNNQISQTGQAVTGQNTAQQNEQSVLQNANTSANNARVGMQSNINNVGAQVSAGNQNMMGNLLGGVGSAVSGIASMFDEGGVVKDDHVKLAEMNAHSLGIHRKNFSEGGGVNSEGPDLGQFKSSETMADEDNFKSAASANPSSEKKGGGIEDLIPIAMTVAAFLKDGGVIEPNPLLSAPQIHGGGPWGNGSFSPGGASGGPNVESTKETSVKSRDLGSDVESIFDNIPDKKPVDVSTRYQETQPASQSSYDNGFRNAAHGGKVAEGPFNSHVANYLAGGGKVPAMVSPGEIYLSPEKVLLVIHEGKDPAKVGEKIKGKAKVKGDSLKNDTVPKDLEEGGVVIDRKNMGSREKRELFVHRALAKNKARMK